LALRWIVLLIFVVAALYFLVGAFQNADFSVPAGLAESEHYKKEAMQFLLLSGGCLLTGILLFITLRQRDKH